MWRGHQAVQSSWQRWLPHLRRDAFVGTKRYSSRYLSCAFSYAADIMILLRQPSIPSAAFPLLDRQRHVSAHNQFFSTRLLRVPMMKDLHSVEEVITTAYDYLDVMSRRDVSAVWARIALLMTKRQPKQRGNPSNNRGDVSFEDMEYMLYTIFDDTTNGIQDCNMRELTETTLGMVKIVKILQQERMRRGEDSSRVILRRLLLDNKGANANRELFQFLAEKARDELHRFDARCLTNFAYAYALINYVPEFHDGSDLFDHIGTEAVPIKTEFNAQNISNILWAYATVNKPQHALFQVMGDHIVKSDSLDRFVHPQDFSNTVWAYATAGAHHPELFEKMANHIVKSDSLDRFNPQELSNTVWAYATTNAHHLKLFEKVANHIVRSDILDRFNSQDFSNTVWAYANADIPQPKLFEKVANHIVKSDGLDRFKPQALSNTVWAYATADAQHPKLFEKVANHIVKSDSLDRFNPQALSNTMWAYATADAQHPKLFEKVANHIVKSDGLDRFNPQNLKDTVWAYATAEVRHPKLFEKVANHIVKSDSLDRFNPQDIANTVWAYATVGIIDRQLFSSFAATAAKNIDSFNNQCLANIAWSFAAANVDAPTLFTDHFTHMCVQKKDGFNSEDLKQFYQWHLWHTKEKSRDGLPEELLDSCYNAFISANTTISKFQNDVVAQLTSIGLDPKEEVLLGSGYSIDAIVEINGKTVCVEADGPSHFIGRSKSPTGSSLLKRRQVPSIDGVELLSVPYWGWDKLGKDGTKKQEYLRKLLGLTS